MNDIKDVPIDYELEYNGQVYTIVHLPFVEKKVNIEVNDDVLLSVKWFGAMPEKVAAALIDVFEDAFAQGRKEGYSDCQYDVKKVLGL